MMALSVLALILFSASSPKSVKSAKESLYKVIRVNGKILFIKTGASLKTGDNYVEGTPLSFASNRDRAAIINKIRGRFILQPNPKGKPIVLQATSNIEARSAGSVLLNVLDVKNYFSDSCVFIGDVKVKAGKESFPLTDSQFFYLTYQYKGEKIAKKLPHNGQVITISEADVFSIDGKRIPTFDAEMTLYYMRGDIASKMGVFKPLFPNLEQMKEEVQVLLEGLGDMSADKKQEEVATYMGEFYGKPQKENLNNWLFKTFGLGIQQETNFK